VNSGAEYSRARPAYHGSVAHFCINCGVPLQPRAIEGRDLEACPRCDFVLWRDPKVVTLVVVETEGGQVVLGRRAIEPGYGLWCLPGGFVNDDEDPVAAAARECREEIEADVEITSLLGVYHIAKQDAPSMIGLAYTGRVRQGSTPGAGSEMLEVASFPPDGLPELAFPSHEWAMREWFGQRTASAR
jgi:8-oxo-dGTP diphosphatase